MDNSHQQSFFELITKKNADPLIKNNDGDTPLDIIEIPLANVFDYGWSASLSAHFSVIKYREECKNIIFFHHFIDSTDAALKKLQLPQQVSKASFAGSYS
jgi:hypothetical protein